MLWFATVAFLDVKIERNVKVTKHEAPNDAITSLLLVQDFFIEWQLRQLFSEFSCSKKNYIELQIQQIFQMKLVEMGVPWILRESECVWRRQTIFHRFSLCWTELVILDVVHSNPTFAQWTVTDSQTSFIEHNYILFDVIYNVYLLTFIACNMLL